MDKQEFKCLGADDGTACDLMVEYTTKILSGNRSARPIAQATEEVYAYLTCDKGHEHKYKVKRQKTN